MSVRDGIWPYMVEQVVEQQQALCAALLELRKGDLMQSDQEFTAIEM